MTTVITIRFLQTESAKCENILLRNLDELTLKIKSLRWSQRMRMNEAFECYSKRKKMEIHNYITVGQCSPSWSEALCIVFHSALGRLFFTSGWKHCPSSDLYWMPDQLKASQWENVLFIDSQEKFGICNTETLHGLWTISSTSSAAPTLIPHR